MNQAPCATAASSDAMHFFTSMSPAAGSSHAGLGDHNMLTDLQGGGANPNLIDAASSQNAWTSARGAKSDHIPFADDNLAQ